MHIKFTGEKAWSRIRLFVSGTGVDGRLTAYACPLLLVILLGIGTWAQAPRPATLPVPARATGTANVVPVQHTNTPEMTAADVSAFLDGIMPEQLAAGRYRRRRRPRD